MIYHKIKHIPQSAEIEATFEALHLQGHEDVSNFKQRFPNVKRIQLDRAGDSNSYHRNYKTLQQLCDAYSLEGLTVIDAHSLYIPDSLWTSNLRHLYIKNYWNKHKSLEVPTFFDNQLETIHISCSSNCRVSPALFRSPCLKKVTLSGVEEGLESIGEAQHLESLTLVRYEKERLCFDFNHLNQLQHIEFQQCTFTELPNLSYCPQLTTLILKNLPHLQHLPNEWDTFQQIQTIELHQLSNCVGNNLTFKELPMLRKLHINDLTVTNNPDFLGNMPSLERMRLENINIHQFNIRVFASTQLAYLLIKNCPNLKELPHPDSFPKLAVLEVLECLKLNLPNKIWIKKDLTRFNYNFLPKNKLKSSLINAFKTMSEAEQIAFNVHPNLDTEGCESVRQLLWSNDAANDLLVLERFENGGVPKILLPDLVGVALSLSDATVRERFKALLKIHLPQNLYNLVYLHSFYLTHVNLIYKIDFDFDISQMAVCGYNRTNNPLWLSFFFKLPQSIDNPYRKMMFDIRFRKMRNWQWGYHLNIASVPLLQAELEFLFLMNRDSPFYRMQINCLGDTLSSKIWQQTELRRLRIVCSCAFISDEIGELIHLERLSIHNKNLKTLPICILDMKHLYSLDVFTGTTPMQLPIAFKTLASRLERFSIYPTPIYT